MKKLTKVVTVRVTEEMYDEMSREAKRRMVKPCDVARWALAHYLELPVTDHVPSWTQSPGWK